MNITNKDINFNLYKKGLFGNKLRTWFTYNDYITSDYFGSVSLRYSGPNGGMYCAYNVKDVKTTIDNFVLSGADPNLFVINESAPDEKLTIQGEITTDENGYSLFYSCKQGKMRDCLINGISINGLSVKLVLECFLSANSYNDIMDLIELYPNHIIEFSTYSMNLGDCKGRNTIIWEVRNY